MQDRFKFRVFRGKNPFGNDGKFIYFNLDGEIGFDDNDIIEQCTRLKDKNGKLIYEGDIVRINGWWDACGPAGYDENLTIVEFDKTVCGFTPMCNYDCDCYVYHDAEECEIIGNIHENPELLEKIDG